MHSLIRQQRIIIQYLISKVYVNELLLSLQWKESFPIKPILFWINSFKFTCTILVLSYITHFNYHNFNNQVEFSWSSRKYLFKYILCNVQMYKHVHKSFHNGQFSRCYPYVQWQRYMYMYMHIGLDWPSFSNLNRMDHIICSKDQYWSVEDYGKKKRQNGCTNH